MLKPRSSAGFRCCLDATRLNFPLPFSLPSGDVLLIAAALGAIAGLTLFFHGFSLLQQRWPSPTYRPSKPSPPTATDAQTALASEAKRTGAGSNEPRNSRAEVIKLTPQESGVLGSASMTQQGRIAAALLKAGVPSPATWSNESMQVTVRVAEQSAKPAPATDADVSRVLQQGATASEFRIPTLNPTAPRHASNWRATLMIWGGPALALACIYLMAAHLGWL
jgi:hypothetical protein